MARITQRDIADALGVSVVTVSNALSGKKGVSEELRGEIIRKAEELGMNAEKYGARSMDHFTIGIYVSGWYISVGTSFYWEMYQKTAYAASRRRCFTILEISNKFHEEPLPRLLQDGGKIDGLIIIGKIREDSLQKIMETAEIPIVLMDFNDPSFGCDAVLSENYYGMYRATQCLAAAGHREIGFLGDFTAYRNGMERFFGYRKCLMERGLVYDPAFTLTEKRLRQERPGWSCRIIFRRRLPAAAIIWRILWSRQSKKEDSGFRRIFLSLPMTIIYRKSSLLASSLRMKWTWTRWRRRR